MLTYVVADYLISHPRTLASSVPIVPLPTLWSVLVDGLAAIWPASRTVIDGTSLGDAWPLSTLPVTAASQPWETIVPFHKLSQWLCYSLMQPMTKLMNIHFAGAELMTGLPEYRNGGLFIDTGVLTLKKAETKRGLEEFHRNAERQGKASLEVTPMFTPDDDVVVEWRAVTVGFLDLLLEEVNSTLGLQGHDKLTLPQMLEAGSWKVCFVFASNLSFTNMHVGRKRNGRDLTPKYPMPTNRNPVRWDRLLNNSFNSTFATLALCKARCVCFFILDPGYGLNNILKKWLGAQNLARKVMIMRCICAVAAYRLTNEHVIF